MGTDKSDCMVRSSSPVPESDNLVRGSEREKGFTMNGGGFSSVETKGLSDDGVVEVVKSGGSSSVLDTKDTALSENDGQVLADSEINGVSCWLNVQGSDVNTVFLVMVLKS